MLRLRAELQLAMSLPDPAKPREWLQVAAELHLVQVRLPLAKRPEQMVVRLPPADLAVRPVQAVVHPLLADQEARQAHLAVGPLRRGRVEHRLPMELARLLLLLAVCRRLAVVVLRRQGLVTCRQRSKQMGDQKHIIMRVCLVAGCLVFLAGTEMAAQSFSSAGQNWSVGWGFPSPSDRSLSLQQAQAIRQAGVTAGPSTVMTNTNYNEYYNDNRSSYQEVTGEVLELGTIDFQLNGDRIGQNTNSIGSMNTGTTNIDVVGSGNEIVATNAAETEGCVDGSIQQETSSYDEIASPSGIDISVNSTGRDMNCAD